jgi:hypothetical protein
MDRSRHSDFRARLDAALTLKDARARIDELAMLAQAPLGIVETIQLDKALARTAHPYDRYPGVRIALLSTHTIEHLLLPSVSRIAAPPVPRSACGLVRSVPPRVARTKLCAESIPAQPDRAVAKCG